MRSLTIWGASFFSAVKRRMTASQYCQKSESSPSISDGLVPLDARIEEEARAIEEAETSLARIEEEYLLHSLRLDAHAGDMELVEDMSSDLDGLDMAWCLLTAVVSACVTTSEDFSMWCEGVHDVASEKPGSFDAVQRILGKTLHHKGDWMDNFKARDGQNAYAIFHRLLGGHDMFATGHSLTPHNPFSMMIEQEGSFSGGVLRATRHLVADTFSRQGLPVPFSSYFDTTAESGRPWNRIIDIVQELSVETTGNKRQAEAIYSHLFTLRAQDFVGGGAALVLTATYIKARNIEDKIRSTQIRLVAYSLSFFAQAAVGATRQNGIPYINYPVGAAMAKELASLLIESDKRTNWLGKETKRLHAEVVQVIEEHDALKDLF